MKRRVPVAVLVAAIVLFPGSIVSAAPSHPCTLGEAASNFQAPLEHLAESLGVCQYRLQLDGRTFTFCEDDVILGGVVDIWPYREGGISREAAIADLELDVFRVWLDGVEQPLMATDYKGAVHPIFGLVVYRHHAFITQLPPGDYESYFEKTYAGNLEFVATVNLNILPRTDAACN